MLLTEQEVIDLTKKILAIVTADDSSASVGSNKQTHLRFAGNNVLTSGSREGRSANVTVWIGGKRGSASTNDLDDASLRTMVDRAEAIAKTAPPDREYMPTPGRQVYKPVNGYFEATANLSLSDRAQQIGSIITECEKMVLSVPAFTQRHLSPEAARQRTAILSLSGRQVSDFL